MVLTIEELSELEDKIMDALSEKITAILTKLNRSGRIEEFLEMIGMTELLQQKQEIYSYKEGKIAVIGDTKVKEETLVGIAKKLGIAKDRLVQGKNEPGPLKKLEKKEKSDNLKQKIIIKAHHTKKMNLILVK